VSVREDASGMLVFLRLMDLRDDGTVLFTPSTLRWRPGADPPVAVDVAQNVLLRGWRRSELETSLAECGFAVESVAGGMACEPWIADQSADTVLVARTAAET